MGMFQGKGILLITPDADMKNRINGVFGGAGLASVLDTAVDLESAVEHIGKSDLIILDYSRFQDCFSFLKALGEVPVIFMVDGNSHPQVESAMEMEPAGCVFRDFADSNILIGMCRRLLTIRELESRIGQLNQKINQQNMELSEANKKLMVYSRESLRTESMASLLFFIRAISQEINNPLAGIVGFSEMILNRVNPADPVRPDLEEIRDNAYLLKDTISRLAKFLGKEKRKKNAIEIHSVIDEVLRYFTPLSERGNISIIKDYANDKFNVDGSEVKLLQAFLSILMNSRIYLSQGGEIRISTVRDGDRVEISFTDNGSGILEDNLEMDKIFMPCYRPSEEGDSSWNMSLAATYGIIKEMGGEIRVSSRYGSGSIYTVILPLRVE